MSGTPNTYGTPRHGRVSSRSGVQSISPSQGGGPRGEQFPGHQPTPTVTYGRDDVPSDLQRWNGQSMIPFLRWGFTVRDERGNAHPNYSFDPDVNNAIRLSETIDDFDRDPRLVHELILRIANPDLGHPSMEWIRANRSLVEIFLYRHHKFHGGLVLPPMAPAVQVLRNYEVAVAQARQQGIVFEDDRYPRIAFPPWNPAPQSSSPNAPFRGSRPSGGSQGSNPPGANPFGNPRDRRPPGSGFGGSGGSLYRGSSGI